MTELLVATRNKGKLREIKELLKEFDLNITSLADFPELPAIVEDGDSFESNAVKKAVEIGEITGKLVMGEDSGLEVEALDNRPGIYSARFAGEKASDSQNNQKLLKELEGVPLEKREARYRCFAALAKGGRLINVVNGACDGVIIEHEQGTNGFGYDPLFLIPEYNKTFGQLSSEVKARISHRAKALAKFKDILSSHLKSNFS